jgi:hypothetical protein
MTAASICTIREILPGGDTGEEFVWTSDDHPVAGQQGGGRAAWIQPLAFGIRHRQVVTRYPGTKKPSRQMLGSERKPFTLTGRFDDRYNYPGFAVDEMRRIEALVERGNMLEISHAGQAFVAVMTDADWAYRKDWDIGYSLAIDPDSRKDEQRPANVSPFTVEQPAQAVDDLTALADQMGEAHSKRPPGLLSTTMKATTDTLRSMNAALANLQDAVKATSGRGSTLGQFQQLAIQAQNVQGNCAGVAEALIGVRSDLETGIRTAAGVIRLEVWAKTLGYLARLAMWRSIQARRGLAERATPRTKQLYRPRKGQSLMEVSRECYGTPYGHRAIASANHLHSYTLTGGEILIIPER